MKLLHSSLDNYEVVLQHLNQNSNQEPFYIDYRNHQMFLTSTSFIIIFYYLNHQLVLILNILLYKYDQKDHILHLMQFA